MSKRSSLTLESHRDKTQRQNRTAITAPDILDRVSPSNLDAEEGILACCIIDGGAEVMTSCVEAKINSEYFFKPAHQILFQAIRDLYSKNSAVDEIILADHLKSQNQLEEIGGYLFITRLTGRIETTAHATYWLNIVREKYLLRRLISTSTKIIERCYTTQGELDQLLEYTEQEIFHISQDRVSDSAKPIKESLSSAVKMINTLIENKGQMSGIASGFVDLDKKTMGFHPQEMIVLAARPSVGKTSFAMNIAEFVILPSKKGIQPRATLVFSLEMGAEQLAMRLLCSYSRVNMERVKNGFISQEEQKKLAKAAQSMRNAPLWIDDSPQITILEMRAKARRIHSKNKLSLIIIDYLQLLSGMDNQVPREQQIAEISRGVKAMAKELNLPVIVLSQLNRESERERRAPRLSDLRESGSIEQDADVVLLLAKKRKRRGTKEEDDEGEETYETGERDLIIAKQRNGPVGTLTLAFRPELTRFENYTKENDL